MPEGDQEVPATPEGDQEVLAVHKGDGHKGTWAHGHMGTRAMDVTMISTVGPSVYGPTPISVQQHRGLPAPPTIGVRRREYVSEDLPKEALAAPEGDKEVLAMPEGHREVLAAPEGDQEALAVPNKEVLTRPKGDQEVLAVPGLPEGGRRRPDGKR